MQLILKDLDEKLQHFKNKVESIHSIKMNSEVWDYFVELIKSVLKNLWDKDITIEIPNFLLNEDGSIDIDWENEIFELLIVITEDNTIDIYGEKLDSPGDEVEIKVSKKLARKWIIDWLETILYTN